MQAFTSTDPSHQGGKQSLSGCGTYKKLLMTAKAAKYLIKQVILIVQTSARMILRFSLANKEKYSKIAIIVEMICK